METENISYCVPDDGYDGEPHWLNDSLGSQISQNHEGWLNSVINAGFSHTKLIQEVYKSDLQALKMNEWNVKSQH